MDSSATAQYIAGFFDGDGYVGLFFSDRYWYRFPCVTFSQAYDGGIPPELGVVQRHYGGSITKLPLHEHRRDRYNLQIQSEDALLRVLPDLKRNCVIKAAQLEIAEKYLSGGRKDAEEFSVALRDAKVKTSTMDVSSLAERLTDPYLAGFFSAEGSIGIYPNGKCSTILETTMGQPSCPSILRAIKSKFGVGCISKAGVLKIRGRDGAAFLNVIYPLLQGQKKDQVEIGLRYLELTQSQRYKKKRPHSVEEEVQNMAKKLKHLKRR